eukprot:CAMPEP_0198123906 /NCGR_PEP_ID=MMETSP1442-20131203/38643_1 /TAXON_ID= /ORGANISM="Craspedostauros australis, Strain CCMP3328" /LENGTH=175 /DNA_ID=CAMNT_0043783197 /DNA_START=1 /DNA_END=528 /DNA_ORIENTATION=+
MVSLQRGAAVAVPAAPTAAVGAAAAGQAHQQPGLLADVPFVQHLGIIVIDDVRPQPIRKANEGQVFVVAIAIAAAVVVTVVVGSVAAAVDAGGAHGGIRCRPQVLRLEHDGTAVRSGISACLSLALRCEVYPLNLIDLSLTHSLTTLSIHFRSACPCESLLSVLLAIVACCDVTL